MTTQLELGEVHEAIVAHVRKKKDQGEQHKADGIEALGFTHAAWMEAATCVLESLANRGSEFTSDDLRRECDAKWVCEPSHPNAWGAVFSKAAKAGLIERIGYRKSTLPSAHARVVAVWRRKG